MCHTKYLTIVFCCIFISNINAQDFWQITSPLSTSLGVRPLVTNSNGNIFAGTSEGITGDGVFRSTDNGNTWTQSGLSNLFIWDIVIDTSGNIFAGTKDQGVWRSTTNGDSWTQINSGFDNLNNSVYALAITAFGSIYAGSINSIYRSTNSGNSWAAINSPIANGFGPLIITSTNEIVVAAGSKLFHSSNNGLSWTEITIVNAQIGALASNQLGHLFVGNLLGIYRSTDSGSNWTQINNGITTGNFIAVNAFTINSVKTIYVGLGGGFGSTSKGVFYSTNNGDNWIELNDGLTNNALMSLTVNPDDYLYAGNTQGQVYKSIDPSTANILNKKLTNLNIPVSHIQPAVSTINFSPPGRKTNNTALQNINSVQITINEVIHSRTGDLTFTLEHLGVTQTVIIEVGGDGQNFSNTILGDDNSTLISAGTPPFTGYFKPENPLNVFNGMDAYGDWTLTITDGNTGNDGTVNSWSLIITLDSPTDVESEYELIADDFVLHQNYPNPFNPVTTIRYSIPQISFVTIKVYDLLGREVAVLVNEEKSAGIYQIEFSGNELSSGIYYYSIKAGEHLETKKMILLK